MTKPDRYPLQSLTNFNDNLAGCTVFSKIDLRRAYQQVCIDKKSQHKSAIITTLGLFKFCRMAYGLKNAGQCFERNIHELLQDLPFLFVYMDDIIVGSKSHDEHYKHLRLLFERLKISGLVININKCVLGKPSVKFLGHYVNHIGVSIPKDRVDAIPNYPTPSNAAELKRFLGMVAYFYRFINHASGKLAPLYKLKNH